MKNIGNPTFGILILILGSQTVKGILRNPVTDRCIHVGKDDQGGTGDGRLLVTAQPCSFRNPKTGHVENPDEWVEVVPISKLPQVKQYTIQKHFPEESTICIQTQEDETITTGGCRSPDSILLIKKIPEHATRPSYEAMLPGPIFTIEQPHSNKCIGVMPGISELQLTNCSSANALQRWIVCRHGGACDVDITWSPARIIFPKDPFNISSDLENIAPILNSQQMQKFMELKDKTELNPTRPEQPTTTITLPPSGMTSPSTSTSTMMENEQIPPKIIINELLYFVHNGLKVLKLPDGKLISIISNFYTRQEIQEALGTLKDNFMLNIDPRSVTLNKSIQILHWMKQLAAHEVGSNVIFASERISRIPPVLSTFRPEQHQPQPPASADLTKLKNLKGRVETNINSVMGRLQDLKTEVLSDLDQLAQNNSSSSEVSEMSRVRVSNKNEQDEMVDAIDLRLGQNGQRQLVRRRYYE